MTKYLSAAGAARVLGVNEKTIRNWIENGKLKARKAAKNRYNVLATDVEGLRREREQSEVLDVSHLFARMGDLERKYSDLEQKYSELLAVVVKMTEKKAVSQLAVGDTAVSPVVQKCARDEKKAVPVSVPDGSLLFADFAEKHGVPRATFSHHVKIGIKGDVVETFKRPKPGRADHTEYWLTPEQQRAALIYWDRHGVKYDRSAE